MTHLICLTLFAIRSFAWSPVMVDTDVKEFFKESGANSAAIAVYLKGEWVFERHYGNSKPDSLYDLASLTKVIATSSVVFKIFDQGWAQVDEALVKQFPRFSKCKALKDQLPCEKKKLITVNMIMRHRAGLRDLVPIEDVRLAAKNGQNPADLFVEMPPMAEPGSTYKYADVDYIVLHAWAEAVLERHHETFEKFLSAKILKPLDMNDTLLLTKDFKDKDRLIPTLKDVQIGTIHDPNTEAMGALNAGHAGLFSTLSDLKKFSEFWLNSKSKPEVLSKHIRDLAILAPKNTLPEESRGLGWDLTSTISDSARGPMVRGFGHTGYTGTSIWIEPYRKTVVIILTNRTLSKPDAETIGPVKKLRLQIADLAWSVE